jgi:hypothetical protein
MSQFRIKNGLIIDNGGIAVTGSISSTAGITGSFSGSIAGFPTDISAFSSSLSSRIALTETTSSAFVTASGSIAARLASNEARTGSFATTGSNVFTSNQTISGSLTTTGTIVAQTLVVQTITSSVEYSSGSNVFGSNTGNTHQFTGSVLVSGSQTVNGTLSGSNATFSGSITANATSIFSNAVNLSAIFSNGGAAGNYNAIELRGGTSGTAVNWQISKDNATANAFELAASTTNGGTTYASPVFKILNTGAATFSSSISATSATFTGLTVSNTSDVYPELKTSTIDADAFLGFSNTGDGNAAWSIGRRNTGEFWISTYTGNFNSGTRTQPLIIATTGAATFSSTIASSGSINVSSTSAGLLANGYQVGKYSYFGYSSGYPGVIIGNTGSQTLFFNVDVSGNPSGAFNGGGQEYVWRNAGSFITPNASNNGYNTIFAWSSTGAATFASSVTTGNTVTINKQNEGLILTAGANTDASYMSTRANNGTGWLIIGSQGSVANYIQTGTGANESAITTVGAYALALGTNQTERMRITSDGFVGITTSGYTVANTFQLGRVFGFMQDINSGYIQANMSNAGNYIVSQYATRIHLDSAIGEINFLTAASGTAGNAVSFTNRMKITNAGIVTRPLQPFFYGGLSTDQSVPATTFTVLNFLSTQGFYGVNTNNCWNNSTYGFTAPVTGNYLVTLSIYTNNVGQIALHVNGTRKHSIPLTVGTSGGSAIIPLTAGEALTLQGYAGGSGVVYANQYHTWVAIYLL